MPPTVLASLIAAQHLSPPQFIPLLLPPVLLFSSYLNVLDYKIDAAGTSAAWSALYFARAWRRRQPLRQRFNTRGIVHGASMGLSVMNVLGGGLVYAIGKRSKEASGEEGAGIV